MAKNILYKGFTQYIPEETEENSAALQAGAAFLKTSTGKDWYDLVKDLSVVDDGATYILLNSEGVVVSVASDPSLFFPAEFSFLIAYNAPTDLANQLGQWKYAKGKFAAYNDEAIQVAEETITEELNWATSQIGALTDLSEISPLDETNTLKLQRLKEYRIQLIQLDPEDAPNIEIPDRPTFKK